MIERIKENSSFILIGIAVLIGVFSPGEAIVPVNKYENLKVPAFKLPPDLKLATSGVPGHFEGINKPVLLGKMPEVVIPEPDEMVAEAEPKVVSEKASKVVAAAPKPSKPKKVYPKLRVRALMIDGDARIANINGRMMSVGEKIYEQTILKIEEDGVLVEGPRGKKIIKMQN